MVRWCLEVGGSPGDMLRREKQVCLVVCFRVGWRFMPVALIDRSIIPIRFLPGRPHVMERVARNLGTKEGPDTWMRKGDTMCNLKSDPVLPSAVEHSIEKEDCHVHIWSRKDACGMDKEDGFKVILLLLMVILDKRVNAGYSRNLAIRFYLSLASHIHTQVRCIHVQTCMVVIWLCWRWRMRENRSQV
jgi:hypothetical protein